MEVNCRSIMVYRYGVVAAKRSVNEIEGFKTFLLNNLVITMQQLDAQHVW